MSIAMISALLQLIQMGLAVAPQIIAACRTVISLIEAGAAPTEEQKAQIEAALDTAHAALQAAKPKPLSSAV